MSTVNQSLPWSNIFKRCYNGVTLSVGPHISHTMIKHCVRYQITAAKKKNLRVNKGCSEFILWFPLGRTSRTTFALHVHLLVHLRQTVSIYVSLSVCHFVIGIQTDPQILLFSSVLEPFISSFFLKRTALISPWYTFHSFESKNITLKTCCRLIA